VNHTLRDLLNRECPFGGITLLLSEDFRQTLPVIQHGSREQIVPPTLTHSNLWPLMRVHYLHQNMRLGQDSESDQWAQQLLHIGVTDGDLELPKHMYCGDDMPSSMPCTLNCSQEIYISLINTSWIIPFSIPEISRSMKSMLPS